MHRNVEWLCYCVVGREWQMERSFQAAMLVHDPEVVFVLGEYSDAVQI